MWFQILSNKQQSLINHVFFRSFFDNAEVSDEDPRHEDAIGELNSGEADKNMKLVNFVMWSQEEEVDANQSEENNDTEDITERLEEEEATKTTESSVEKTEATTEMQLADEDLDLNYGVKTDIRALFDSDSESDSDL